MLVHEYEKNTEGQDFFVGDIHGMYNLLMSQLALVGFDRRVDRLFSVGDIVDRGEDSLKCLGLLHEDWFYCVKGNHEQLMTDTLVAGGVSDQERGISYRIWASNGGDWVDGLSPEMKKALMKDVPLVNELPNAIKVGDIGVIHAECPLQDWDLLAIDSGRYLREEGMWSRKRISAQTQWRVRGVEAVVVGHTPVDKVTVLGNHVYLDSGSCFYDRPLLIKTYEEVLQYVQT